MYGAMTRYEQLTSDGSKRCIKNVFSKNISENIRDIVWLIAAGRLPECVIVKWSCLVTTTKNSRTELHFRRNY